MSKRHWLFDLYLALIGTGHSAEEAKTFITATFPNLSPLELVAVLDNMGDVAKADADYANRLLRSKVAELKDDRSDPRNALASRMFGEVASDG